MSSERASLISRASNIIRRRGAILFAAALWPFVLSVAALMSLTTLSIPTPGSATPWDPIHIWQSMSWLVRSAWILAFIFYFYLTPMLALAGISELVSADVQGTALSFAEAFGRVLRALGRLVTLSLALGFTATIGLRLFVIPGLALLTITTFAVPAIMLEGKGMRAAWSRSAELVRQRRGAVIALYCGLLLAVIVIWSAFVVFSPLTGTSRKVILQLCLLLAPPIVGVFFGTLNTLLFLDIREREQTLARGASSAT